MSTKNEKIAGLIQKNVSEIIQFSLKDPKIGFITITDAKVTNDELSILITLAQELELSQDEIKLINYIVIPPEKQQIDNVVNLLRNTGIISTSQLLHRFHFSPVI